MHQYIGDYQMIMCGNCFAIFGDIVECYAILVKHTDDGFFAGFQYFKELGAKIIW
jgi:hypothetical protein